MISPTIDVPSADQDSHYESVNGVFAPRRGILHREDHYESFGLELLLKMQERHFWYRGRHRFLLRSVRRTGKRLDRSKLGCAIDLGGGCGGWLKYLTDEGSADPQTLALGDSSRTALRLSHRCLDGRVRRYQIDLMDLGWRRRWDTAFLLDVLEHIPEDVAALRQIAASLRPGGLLFVTTPALERFRSYNDELAHHVRRYSTADYARLAGDAGLELLDARYFMFFLSPLLVLGRRFGPDIGRMSPEEIHEHLAKTHRVPARPINAMLSAIFACETPLGHYLKFPWGTSILGVFRKPAE